MKFGKTNLATSMPWGMIQRTGTRVLCADGVIRSVSYIANTADTFFSIPASVKIKGKTVSGYVGTMEHTWIKGVKETDFRAVFCFHKHTNQTNGYLLPEWPNRLHEGEKLNALIDLAYSESEVHA